MPLILGEIWSPWLEIGVSWIATGWHLLGFQRTKQTLSILMLIGRIDINNSKNIMVWTQIIFGKKIIISINTFVF